MGSGEACGGEAGEGLGFLLSPPLAATGRSGRSEGGGDDDGTSVDSTGAGSSAFNPKICDAERPDITV